MLCHLQITMRELNTYRRNEHVRHLNLLSTHVGIKHVGIKHVTYHSHPVLCHLQITMRELK